MSQENVEIVREVFDAYVRGEEAVELFDPEVVWNPADEAPMTGAEEARAYMERWEGEWEWLDTVAEEFVDAGNKVLVTVHFSGKGRESGVEVDARRIRSTRCATG